MCSTRSYPKNMIVAIFCTSRQCCDSRSGYGGSLLNFLFGTEFYPPDFVSFPILLLLLLLLLGVAPHQSCSFPHPEEKLGIKMTGMKKAMCMILWQSNLQNKTDGCFSSASNFWTSGILNAPWACYHSVYTSIFFNWVGMSGGHAKQCQHGCLFCHQPPGGSHSEAEKRSVVPTYEGLTGSERCRPLSIPASTGRRESSQTFRQDKRVVSTPWLVNWLLWPNISVFFVIGVTSRGVVQHVSIYSIDRVRRYRVIFAWFYPVKMALWKQKVKISLQSVIWRLGKVIATVRRLLKKAEDRREKPYRRYNGADLSWSTLHGPQQVVKRYSVPCTFQWPFFKKKIHHNNWGNKQRGNTLKKIRQESSTLNCMYSTQEERGSKRMTVWQLHRWLGQYDAQVKDLSSLSRCIWGPGNNTPSNSRKHRHHL